MKLCVYGGHYGSEGKGSIAEWLCRFGRHTVIKDKKEVVDRKLVVFGENSPNSGHTCSLGKTRNLPATAFYADMVIMGPDSAIDLGVLLEDLRAIRVVRGEDKMPVVIIHEHAAIVCDESRKDEVAMGVVERISSTGSGSGAARWRKCVFRLDDAIIKSRSIDAIRDEGFNIQLVGSTQYLHYVAQCHDEDCLFECSQGTLLDVNFGLFPYVTSRSTLPRTAIERNALGGLGWSYVGVYRTFPIRTGGPSGPTGEDEVSFDDIGVPEEIASVTKRIRRVFMFSPDDFRLSINLTRPHFVAFTHLDYLHLEAKDVALFLSWLEIQLGGKLPWEVQGLFLSDALGRVYNHQQTII